MHIANAFAYKWSYKYDIDKWQFDLRVNYSIAYVPPYLRSRHHHKDYNEDTTLVLSCNG